MRKYGARGGALWRRVWTWPGRSDDAAAALVRDRRGGIVVAGSSGSSWLILKYSGGGYLQWVRRGRAAFAHAAFTAVAVDGSGDVYAAGAGTPAGGDSQVLLRKYSAGGALRWQKTLSSGAGDAAAVAVIVGDGDVYVTGRSTDRTGDERGDARRSTPRRASRRWVRAYAAGGGEAVRPTAIGYAAGPVVAGWGVAAGGSPEGFVARYDAAGTPAWVAGYEGAGVTGDRFDAVTADAGGACVTGSRWIGGEQQMITLRFDAAGALVWERVQGDGDAGPGRVPPRRRVLQRRRHRRLRPRASSRRPACRCGTSRCRRPATTDFGPSRWARPAATTCTPPAPPRAAAGGAAAMLIRYRP